MNFKTRRATTLRWLAAFALAATAAAYAARPAAHAVATEPATAAQDVIGLERRISLVEQRLNDSKCSVSA